MIAKLHSFRTLLLAMVVGCVPSAAARKTTPTQGKTMTGSAQCTRTVGPADAEGLQDILDGLSVGSVLCFEPGRYVAQLMVRRSLTLRGLAEGVVLDAKGRGPVIVVNGSDATVEITDLTLRCGSGGAGGHGGNLSVSRSKYVVVRRATLEAGESDGNGGGALFARIGEVVLEGCRLTANHGAKAAAVLADEVAHVTLRDCVIAGNTGKSPAVAAYQNGRLTVQHTTIADNEGPAIYLLGQEPDTLALEVDGGLLGNPALVLSGQPQPRAQVRRSMLSSALPAGIDAGENIVGEIKLDGQHRPIPGSRAVGYGAR